MELALGQRGTGNASGGSEDAQCRRLTIGTRRVHRLWWWKLFSPSAAG